MYSIYSVLWVLYLSINWRTKSSNSAEAEHNSFSTCTKKNQRKDWVAHELSHVKNNIRTGGYLTCVRSFLVWRAAEQSTNGTRVTKVANNWNVIWKNKKNIWKHTRLHKTSEICVSLWVCNLHCRTKRQSIAKFFFLFCFFYHRLY